MKNLHPFSENPLNTEKFLYMAMRNKPGPKANVEGATSSAEKEQNDLKVAETLDKMAFLLGQVDDKVKHFEERVKHYSASLGHVTRNKGNYSTRVRGQIKDRLKENSGALLKYKILQRRLQKTNENLSKIETNKNGEYSKVALKTLGKINKTIDKQGKIWGFNLRMEMIYRTHIKAFGDLESSRTNLANIKNMFLLMKDGERQNYKGYKVSRKGNKILLMHKGVKREFSFAVKGKNLTWEIKDEKGETIRTKPSRSHSLEGLNEDDSGEASLTQMNKFYFYKPESAVSNFSKYKIKTAATAKVKPAADINDAKRKAPAKVKTFGTKPKAKVAPKRVSTGPTTIDVRPTTILGKRVEGKIKFMKNLLASKIKMVGVTHEIAMQGSAQYKEAYGKIQKAIRALNSALRNKDSYNRNLKLERINNELNSVAQNTKTKFPARLLPKQKEKPKQWKEAVSETPETNKALKKWGTDLSRRIGMAANAVYGRITAVKKFLSASKAKNKMKHLTQYKNALDKVGKEVKKQSGPAIIKAANELAKVYKMIPKELDPVTRESFMIKLNTPPANLAKVALLPSLIIGQDGVVKRTPNRAVASKPKAKPSVVMSQLKRIAKKPKAAAPKQKETLAGKENLQFKKWAKKTSKNLNALLKDTGLVMFIKNLYSAKVLQKFSVYIARTRLKLNNPKLTFVEAAKLQADLVSKFKILKKVFEHPKNKKQYSKEVVGGNRTRISIIAGLQRPPLMTHPKTAADKQAIAKRVESRRRFEEKNAAMFGKPKVAAKPKEKKPNKQYLDDIYS